MKEKRIQFLLSNTYRFTLWLLYRLAVKAGYDRIVPRCMEPWMLSTVSCDGYVLCNCTASLKPFVLGSIQEQSLGEIWRGEKYQKLRNQIERGILPHYRCVGCANINKEQFVKLLQLIYPDPQLKKLFLEPSAACNLHCISCQNRNVLERRESHFMSLAVADKVIDGMVKEGTVKTVYPFFEGELFVNKNSYNILRRIRDSLPEVFILLHTNGELLNSEKKRKAVIETVDHIIFSIDGSDSKSYVRYRKGGNFTKCYQNMTDLIKERDKLHRKAPRVDWKYLLFRWNSSNTQLNCAREMAISAGVDRLWFVPTIRPFWGMSFKHLLWRREIADEKIGRIFEDRSFASQKEQRFA